MAILVDKNLIVTERQALSGLRAVNETRNIHGSTDMQQRENVVACPTKHEYLSQVVFTSVASSSSELHAAYPAAKIGTEIKVLVCAGGAVTAGEKWFKLGSTSWTKLHA